MSKFEEHKVNAENLEQEIWNIDANDETQTSEATTQEGKFVIDQFYRHLPKQENVASWYAGFTPEGYNEWARVVNFTEPYHIIDQVVKNP